jgi:hypothetical protein
MPRPANLVRPGIVAVVAVAMLARTWGTWPDPLVDFGTRLYTAWQVSLGRVLYRDVDCYSGPLSSYTNAGMFRVFGVGLHTLEGANVVVLVAAMALAYRLARRASGPAAAVAGGVVFGLVFAFGQGVELGNYNWVTPYMPELTHGVLLTLVAIACLDRFAGTGRLRWAAMAGTAGGLTLLTRIEPAAACLAVAVAQLVATAWVTRASPRRLGLTLTAVAAPAVGAVLVAVLGLSLAMPVSDAVRGALGAWRWAFDPRITGLAFYRRLVGLDDVRGNLLVLARWSVAYAFILAVTVGIALRLRWAAWPAGVVAAVTMLVTFDRINWPAALVPLPLCLLAAAGPAITAVVRRRDGAPLRLSLVVFGLALLAKMLLVTHAYHYGFALAMPGTLVLVAIVAEELPAWVERRGGRGAVVRAVALPIGVAFVAFTWVVQGRLLATKRWTVAGGGPDSFVASSRGLEVAEVCSWVDLRLPPDGTVAVLPQGLMVNYLARRASPTRYVNLMPPEVLTAGEPAILAALQCRSPNVVVIDGSATRDGQFTLDGEYDWGRAVIDWVHGHYRLAERVALLPPEVTRYRFEIWVRR